MLEDWSICKVFYHNEISIFLKVSFLLSNNSLHLEALKLKAFDKLKFCLWQDVCRHICTDRYHSCLHGWTVIGQGGMVLNWDWGGLGWILGRSFYTEGGDALEQVAQGGCGCPIPGGIQGQAGCDSGQPGLEVGNPAHSRGVETRWSLWSFSIQTILWLCDHGDCLLLRNVKSKFRWQLMSVQRLQYGCLLQLSFNLAKSLN